MPILDHLGQGFLSGMSSASEYTSSEGLGEGDEIKAEMIDDLAVKHWPLCMRHLHDSLRRDRHLKHYGRLQYGLFLKACFSIARARPDTNSLTRLLVFLLKKPLYSGERHSEVG